MTPFAKSPLAFVIAALALFGLAFAAHADATADLIAKAKAERLVGERPDGYLGLVTGSTPEEIVRAVRETNIKRKAVYADLARAKGATIEVVAALTGEKLIARASKGEMVMDTSGNWHPVQ